MPVFTELDGDACRFPAGIPQDRLELDRLTQELTRQYNNRCKYNVSIKPEAENLDRNRVSIKITASEGKAA